MALTFDLRQVRILPTVPTEPLVFVTINGTVTLDQSQVTTLRMIIQRAGRVTAIAALRQLGGYDGARVDGSKMFLVDAKNIIEKLDTVVPPTLEERRLALNHAREFALRLAAELERA